MKRVVVIGGGFAGLSAASYLAKEGLEVTLLEKHATLGGRARKFSENGFVFDMGPSWYWMPDVFEEYFGHFGHQVADFYKLQRLDPSYDVFFEKEKLSIPASEKELYKLFEKYEPGCTQRLQNFLTEAETKYKIGLGEFVSKPSLSVLEFAKIDLLVKARKLDVLKSMKKHVSEVVSNPYLKLILEFPVLFLGQTAAKIPALYSLMNYADLKLGTWYPMGGMNKIVEGMEKVAKEMGVDLQQNQNVFQIRSHKGKAYEVATMKNNFKADFVVSAADYAHTEQNLLSENDRSYSKKYWSNRKMAPSSLLYYVGLNTKIDGLKHHSLFFDANFEQHAHEIYSAHSWPQDPLFYVCAPSRTDPSVAPEGKENLFFLIPTSVELSQDDDRIRDKYFKIICKRMKKHFSIDLQEHIEFYKSFSRREFISEYNSLKGNAYGLANTLDQTAFLKPKMRSKKIENLFFAGQLTTPGPGVPPSLISGKVAAEQILQLI